MIRRKRFTIFVGNPGVGKSTLLHSFPNAPQFRSGLSFGGGLTQRLQLAEISESEVIGDTPGLSDMALRKQAAAEIEKGMKKNGLYRLIFVITLEAGRARPDDATTVRLILESIDTAIPFGILINKLEDRAYNLLTSDPELQKRVVTGILAGVPERSTRFFHAVRMEEELEGRDNAMPPEGVKRGVMAWLEGVPFGLVEESQVGRIRTETYDELMDWTSKEIERLKADKKEVEKRFQEMLKKEREEAEEREKALVQKTDKKIAKIESQSQKQMQHFEKEIEEGKKREGKMQQETENLRNQSAELRGMVEQQKKQLQEQPKGGGWSININLDPGILKAFF